MPITNRELIQTLLKFPLDEKVFIQYCGVDYVQRILGFTGKGFVMLQSKQRLYTQDEVNMLCSIAYLDGVDHALVGVNRNVKENENV